MAWEIEKEYVDLAEMVHRTVYVEKSLQAADGSPVRHVDDIVLGADAPSSTRGLGSGAFTLQASGQLMDANGADFDPKLRQTEMLARLNSMHLAGRAYAQKHGIRIRVAAAKAAPLRANR